MTLSELRSEAAELTVPDADGDLWRIAAPLAQSTPRPDFQFFYLYLRNPGGGFRRASRSRFADYPSLARTYATRIGGGWIAWVVRYAEVLSYGAALAVGAGLWFLLGDLVGDLPGVAVLIGMVVVAAALWLSTLRATSVPYREAQRLAAVTRAAAVGVTGAVPWVATLDTGDVTDSGRISLTAAVVTVAAVLSFARNPSPFTYAIAVGAWVTTCAASGIVLAEVLYDGPDRLASAQLGTLVAVCLAYPIATRTAHLRWIPPAVVFLAGAAVTAIVTTMASTPSDLHTVDVVVLGAVAAASAWFSRRSLPSPFRGYHRGSAIAIASSVGLLALVRAPWDVFGSLFDWLADVPLPLFLIAAGAMALVGIAVTIRIAVGRVDRSEEGNGPG